MGRRLACMQQIVGRAFASNGCSQCGFVHLWLVEGEEATLRDSAVGQPSRRAVVVRLSEILGGGGMKARRMRKYGGGGQGDVHCERVCGNA